MSQPTLSIVIVNYNGKHFLDECFASIKQFVTCPHEVIVVDNDSKDGSVEYIRTHFADVKLIASTVNTGFTGGNNLGAKQASGELLLLLNNDTKLTQNIQSVIDAFGDPTLGAMGVQLTYGDGRYQPSIGYEHSPMRLVLSWLGLSKVAFLPSVFRRTVNQVEFYQHNHTNVNWVSGAFLMTRTALWHAIGGLDERYFMYAEDVDYCKEVRNRGYRIDYCATVKVIHYEGGGKAWIGKNAMLRTMRSYHLFTKKHYGALQAFVASVLVGVVLMVRVPLYWALYLCTNSAIYKDKAKSYFEVAMKTILLKT